jgi:hypothetical protein
MHPVVIIFPKLLGNTYMQPEVLDRVRGEGLCWLGVFLSDVTFKPWRQGMQLINPAGCWTVSRLGLLMPVLLCRYGMMDGMNRKQY